MVVLPSLGGQQRHANYLLGGTMPDATTTTTTHELCELRPDAWLSQVDHWGCSCGSPIWVDVTAATCTASRQILGHLVHHDPAVATAALRAM